jgi:hypothetical protein
MIRVADSDLRKDGAEIRNQVAYRHERIILQHSCSGTALVSGGPDPDRLDIDELPNPIRGELSAVA